MSISNIRRGTAGIFLLLAEITVAFGGWSHEQRENPVTGEIVERVTSPWVASETLGETNVERSRARVVVTCSIEQGINARLAFSESLTIKSTGIGYEGLQLETAVRWDNTVIDEYFALELNADGNQTHALRFLLGDLAHIQMREHSRMITEIPLVGRSPIFLRFDIEPFAQMSSKGIRGCINAIQEKKREATEAARAEQERIEAARDRHDQVVMRAVASAWQRPMGMSDGLSCALAVGVSVTGEVQDVRVIDTSGNRGYDQSAKTAVARASPIPMPDDEAVAQSYAEKGLNLKFGK